MNIRVLYERTFHVWSNYQQMFVFLVRTKVWTAKNVVRNAKIRHHIIRKCSIVWNAYVYHTMLHIWIIIWCRIYALRTHCEQTQNQVNRSRKKKSLSIFFSFFQNDFESEIELHLEAKQNVEENIRICSSKP